MNKKIYQNDATYNKDKTPTPRPPRHQDHQDTKTTKTPRPPRHQAPTPSTTTKHTNQQNPTPRPPEQQDHQDPQDHQNIKHRHQAQPPSTPTNKTQPQAATPTTKTPNRLKAIFDQIFKPMKPDPKHRTTLEADRRKTKIFKKRISIKFRSKVL